MLCIYFVCVGDISFEIKTEADSSDTNEYQHDDMSSTGMTVFMTLHYSINFYVLQHIIHVADTAQFGRFSNINKI